MTPNKPMTKEEVVKDIILKLCTKKYNKERKTIDLSIEGNQLEEIVTQIALLTQQEQSQPMSEELVEEFNKFIKKWTGNSYPHLIDTDENDGEAFRDKIREALSQRFSLPRLALPQKEKG